MIKNSLIIKDILKRYRWLYIAVIIISLINLSIFFLYRLPVEPFIYAMILNIFVLLCIFLIIFFIERNKAVQIRNIKEHSFEEWCAFPAPDSLPEADYQEMISFLSAKAGEILNESIKKSEEADDYYTNWVHQVKTPIAVMKLLLGNDESSLSKDLKAELFRIEQYVDMALLYIRLDSKENDLLIREYSLDELIKEAVRKHASSFINKRIKLDYAGTDKKVVTDKKWLLCILDQLISNAIKYTKEGSVTITAEENSLSVLDTGIGIAKEDLPRIFEKGFTGNNGRTDKKSSGLGLYLCQKAADKININISAVSEPGNGSKFTLRFPQSHTL